MRDEFYPYNLLQAVLEKKTEEIPVELTADIKAGIEYALGTLEYRDREILRLRFQEQISRAAIGEKLDITQDRVRQLEQRVIQRLREPYRLNYMKYGVAGYVRKACTEEYQKGYRLGYEKGYENCAADMENGVTREGYDVSVLHMPIDSMDLDVRPYNCLLRAGCQTVGDCVRMDYDKIRRIRNLGIKSARQIAQALQQMEITHTAWDRFLVEEAR